eukprot:4727201-Amphidinium_carterae.2
MRNIFVTCVMRGNDPSSTTGTLRPLLVQVVDVMNSNVQQHVWLQLTTLLFSLHYDTLLPPPPPPPPPPLQPPAVHPFTEPLSINSAVYVTLLVTSSLPATYCPAVPLMPVTSKDERMST